MRAIHTLPVAKTQAANGALGLEAGRSCRQCRRTARAHREAKAFMVRGSLRPGSKPELPACPGTWRRKPQPGQERRAVPSSFAFSQEAAESAPVSWRKREVNLDLAGQAQRGDLPVMVRLTNCKLSVQSKVSMLSIVNVWRPARACIAASITRPMQRASIWSACGLPPLSHAPACWRLACGDCHPEPRLMREGSLLWGKQ